MSTLAASPPVPARAETPVGIFEGWRALAAERRIDRAALALGLCAVPLSIAVAETFIAVALAARVALLARGRVTLRLPRVLWYWLPWAGLETAFWAFSPDRAAGWSEIRHLLLVAAMFLVLPALDRASDRGLVWRGIFVTSSLGGLFLIGDFVGRLILYRRELSVTPDPSLYLRTGGLLNHWMVYGTIEIMVVAGLVAFWRLYPAERRRWLPVYAIHAAAIVLSLTRMIWVACFLILAIDLIWRRSKWLVALPALPLALYFLAPGAVRARINESLKPSHYSNLERIQMLRVGWQIVRERPLTGAGPGRVNQLYRSYLGPHDPVPAWHGHLHNNLVQLAADFGLPVVGTAMVFLLALFGSLVRAWKSAHDPAARFSCQTALLALAGFLTAGMFDYTYGHALALILLSFAVLSPLRATRESSI
ncbi:MAG: O-antigen ligase family protein [Terriglobia bacterium]